jgi:hypothetical protein
VTSGTEALARRSTAMRPKIGFLNIECVGARAAGFIAVYHRESQPAGDVRGIGYRPARTRALGAKRRARCAPSGKFSRFRCRLACFLIVLSLSLLGARFAQRFRCFGRASRARVPASRRASARATLIMVTPVTMSQLFLLPVGRESRVVSASGLTVCVVCVSSAVCVCGVCLVVVAWAAGRPRPGGPGAGARGARESLLSFITKGVLYRRKQKNFL